MRQEDVAGLLGGHHGGDRGDVPVERVRRERRRLDAQHLRHPGGRQVGGGRRGLGAQDRDGHRPAGLLRRRDSLPAGLVERAALLFGDDENHEITRASSRSAATRAFAASAGLPPIICVCFRFSGT